MEDILEVITGLERIHATIRRANLVYKERDFVLEPAFNEFPGHPFQQQAVHQPRKNHQANAGRQ